MPNPPKKIKKKWSELSFWGKAGRIALWVGIGTGLVLTGAGIAGGVMAAAAVTSAAAPAVSAVWTALTVSGATTAAVLGTTKVVQKVAIDKKPNPAYVAPVVTTPPPVVTNPPIVNAPVVTNAPVRRVGQFNRGMTAPRTRQSSAGQQFVQPPNP